MGYHIRKIEKGKLGEFSKIKEEYEELLDGFEQGNKLLQLIEMSDLLGAIDAYATQFNLSLKDLVKMKNSTKSAFEDGDRQ